MVWVESAYPCGKRNLTGESENLHYIYTPKNWLDYTPLTFSIYTVDYFRMSITGYCIWYWVAVMLHPVCAGVSCSPKSDLHANYIKASTNKRAWTCAIIFLLSGETCLRNKIFLQLFTVYNTTLAYTGCIFAEVNMQIGCLMLTIYSVISFIYTKELFLWKRILGW